MELKDFNGVNKTLYDYLNRFCSDQFGPIQKCKVVNFKWKGGFIDVIFEVKSQLITQEFQGCVLKGQGVLELIYIKM